MSQNQTPESGAPDPLKEALEAGASQAPMEAIEEESFESPVEVEVPVAQEIPVETDVDVDGPEIEAIGFEESDSATSVDMTGVATANPNVILSEPYCGALPKIQKVPLADAVTLPSVPAIELNRLIDAIPAEDLNATDTGRAWVEMIAAQQNLMINLNSLDASQNQEGSEWVQRVEIEGERFGIAAPRFGDEKEIGPLSGDRAVQIMQGVLGLGATLRVPLWHTGIYVTIKAPSDSELFELHRLIGTEKATLGRAIHGFLYSNSSVLTNMHLVDFILRHVYTASVSFENPVDLKQIIDLDDLQTLIWGALCTIYPAGYPYRRPCVKGPQACDHVVVENLAISKLLFVNHRRLTEGRRKHMKRRSHKATMEDIARYKADESHKVPNEIVVDENVRVYLRNPTLAEYEESGSGWIRSLQESTDAAFAGRLSADETNNYIVQAAKTEAINNYAHYIEKIVIRNKRADGDNTITDRETLSRTLAAMSADQNVYTTIIEGIGKYIDDRALAITALPRYSCPKCEQDQGVVPERTLANGQVIPEQHLSTKKNPYLIPLDMASLFFFTTGRQITRALSSRNFS